MIKAKRIIITGFLIALCIVTSNAFAFSLNTGSSIYPTQPAKWDFSSSNFSLEQITIIDGSASYCFLSSLGSIEIIDFDEQIELPPGEIEISEDKNLMKISQESSGGEVTVTKKVEGYEDRISCKVSVKNNIQRDVKLEIVLRLPVKVTNDFNYWDGNIVHSISDGIIKRSTLPNTFPLSFLYNDKFGFAVGLAPDTLISQLENGIDGEHNLYYSTKVAILPAMETEIEFILFTARPSFGHLEALNGYYRRFPTYFEPSPGVDPRLTSMGTGASYSSRYTVDSTKAKRIGTILGAFNSTWDWGYAPFKRSGDFWGREELWNYEMTEGDAAKLASRVDRDLDYYDLNNFHKQRKALFENADLIENCNLAFYLINWVERNYVEEKGWLKYVYPYQGTPLLSNWVTGHASEYHIYPWASPFEDILKKDIPLLLDELNMNSIAYDNYFNNAIYRGELDYPIEGWSYDMRGKYITTAIGFRYFVEYLKQLDKDGFTPGLIGNTHFSQGSVGAEFTSAFFADAFILETKLYNGVDREDKDALDDLFYNRYFVGHKPVYLWNHFYQLNIGEIYDWESLSPEEIRLLYQNNLRNIIQASYQYGFIPVYNAVVGNELMIQEMPTILDIQMRGFEPLSASKGSEEFLRQRYGTGLKSAIVISNPTSESKTTKEKVQNRYLSEFEILPANYFGNSLEFSLVKGETSFEATIAPLQNMITIVPLGIKIDDEEVKLEGVSSGQKAIDKNQFIFVLESNKDTNVEFSPSDSVDWRISELIVNDQIISHPYRALLVEGTNIIKVIYQSSIFKASEDALLGFNYLDAEILISSEADIREKAAAQMLQGYFEVKENQTIPIRTGIRVDPTEHTIVFEKSNDGLKNGIFISNSGKLITIRGQNSFQIQQDTWKLLRVLDKKYPYLGALYFNNKATKEMIKKAGLEGKPALIIEDEDYVQEVSKKEEEMEFISSDNLPVVKINHFNNTPILDGKLDEDVWQNAIVIDDFILLSGGEPTQKTITKIFYTDEALYLGFTCYEKNMDQIFSYITEHDGPVWKDDDVEIFLAPGIDELSEKYPYYQFIVNPIGTQWEAYNKNVDYNGNWVAATQKEKDYWSVEIKIPFSELNNSNAKSWRFNIARGEKPNGEWSSWAPLKKILDQPALFGVLYFE